MSHETLNLNADADVEKATLRAVAAQAIEEALKGEPPAVAHDPGTPIDITEAQALARLAQGLQFAADDDVTVHAPGTNLRITLGDLDTLGIDHVMADPRTIEADPVHDQGNVLLALGLDTASADPAADMLALLEGFGEPIFVDAANAGITFSRAESNVFDAAPEALQDDVVARLVDLGVDFVNVVGTEVPDDSISL